MAFCTNCGSQIPDGASTCPKCGMTQAGAAPAPSGSVPNPTFNASGSNDFGGSYQGQNQTPEVDNGGFGWGLLGCCIPLVGLILFLVWKDNKPRTSKAAGVGALVGVIISVVMYVLSLVLGVGAAMLGG